MLGGLRVLVRRQDVDHSREVLDSDCRRRIAGSSGPALTGGVTAGWRGGPQTDFYVYFFVGTVLGLPGLP
jgi:hypothetical protein